MTLNRVYQIRIFLFFTCLLPLIANSATEEVINEKRTRVAMRMIGHEVLRCMGDHDSRIMPIEKIDNHYKIPFEFEFGFDPDDIISIIDRIMTETNVASRYFIEVEQCETKEIVHSYEGGTGIIPCRGRILPKDCYSLLITLLDDSGTVVQLSEDVSMTLAGAKNVNSFKIGLLIISLLILIGVFVYFFKNKNLAEIDPNLILIGASRFDKRNMVLSFENKKVELSNKEAELLSLLHTSANAPVEREVILHRVWGDEGDYVGRTLDVFISKLRKKLEADTSVKIVNIRGIGYKLVMNIPS